MLIDGWYALCLLRHCNPYNIVVGICCGGPDEFDAVAAAELFQYSNELDKGTCPHRTPMCQIWVYGGASFQFNPFELLHQHLVKVV